MKKLSILLVILAISFSSMFAQLTHVDAQLFGNSRDVSAPLTKDVGIINEDVFTGEFTFKNTKDSDVQLVGVGLPAGISVMFTDRFVAPNKEVSFMASINKKYLENLNGQSNFMVQLDIIYIQKDSNGTSEKFTTPYIIKGEFH